MPLNFLTKLCRGFKFMLESVKILKIYKLNIMSVITVLLLYGLTMFLSCYDYSVKKSISLKLWYDQPANDTVIDNSNTWKDDEEWLKALPLGNGSLGAMVFGDVNFERIQLNEESMWSGSPFDNDNPEAFPAQEKIKQLLFEVQYKEAYKLTMETQIANGKGTGHGEGANVPFGCYQTLGDLWIDFERESKYEDYYRELDLENAVVRINYSQDGTNYKREVFVSHPDQLLVIRLSSDQS